MKSLPGDWTDHWKVGTCVQQVAPRSYLMDVKGALYHRNRVLLRVVESAPPPCYEQPLDAQLEHRKT